MAAVIHVKLSGEGDFGPVDVECAIPPARLPVVMAALFGQAQPVSGMASAAGTTGIVAGQGRAHTRVGQDNLRNASGGSADKSIPGGKLTDEQLDVPGLSAVDPGMFIAAFAGEFADFVGRLQPRGFAETILLAAIWLQYRDARKFITREDIRRLLRRQDHLRMPRNFSRDFHAAVKRGYLESVENDDGYAVSSCGYQWFRKECIK